MASHAVPRTLSASVGARSAIARVGSGAGSMAGGRLGMTGTGPVRWASAAYAHMKVKKYNWVEVRGHHDAEASTPIVWCSFPHMPHPLWLAKNISAACC